MKKNDNEYKKSGVDVELGYEAVKLIKPHIEKTKTSEVIGEIGGFGGFFKPNLKDYKEAVFVSSTDGVGTKIKIAIKQNKHNTIGIDCVAMCANDIICSGAKPLFFLDYISCGKNNPKKIEQIVCGIANGCIQSKMALIGGETAEHPKVMNEDDYDLAGFAVGIVEKNKILPQKNLNPKDSLIAIKSSGLHSNGYSLVREIFDIENSNLNYYDNFLEENLADVLLKPTKIYVSSILNLTSKVNIKAICHITGGGFYENIPRILPENITAKIYRKNIKVPKIFQLIMKKGNISEHNMFEIFNMGVGMIVVVDKADEENTLKILNKDEIMAYTIGELSKEDVKVKIV